MERECSRVESLTNMSLMTHRDSLLTHYYLQVINWKLATVGMNPTAESYLILHRFGSVSAIVAASDL